MVERQKNNAATSADQPDTAVPSSLDAVGVVEAARTMNTVRTVDAVDVVDGEDMYHQREATFFSNPERPVSSSLGLNHTPIQWHTPSIPSATPSPQIYPTFDAMLESGISPIPSHLDAAFEGLFGPTQQVAFLAESNPAGTTPSALPSPPYHSSVNYYSPSGSSSSSSTSSMGKPFATPLSGICYKTSQTKSLLLHVAIRTRKKSMVRLLLRRGVSTINEQDTNGRTALHVAAQSGDEEMVETLMKHGADPKALDKHGRDALYCAVEQGHEQVVEMLLDAIPRND